MKTKIFLLLISLCLLVMLISCKSEEQITKNKDKNSFAIELLIKDLENKNPDVRRRAAQRAYNTKDPRVIEPLITTLLKDEDEHVRVSAARALGSINDSRAVEPLIIALSNDKSEHVRRFVAESLSKTKDPLAVEPLISALNDKSSYVRNNAALALGEIRDTRAIEPLIKILKEGNSFDNKGVAAEALGKIKAPSAIEPLITVLLNDKEDEFVRTSASSALGNIGDTRAVEPLISVLLKDENIWIRASAARVLGDIGDLRAVEPLISVLKDKSSFVRSSAARALGKIKDPRAIKPLIALRKDEDSYTQRSASMSLDQIIGQGSRIVSPADEAKSIFSAEDFKSFKKLKPKPDASREGICTIVNGKVQLSSPVAHIEEQTKEIIEIDTDIVTNTIWESGNAYHITENINVQALLVIEPGTVVQYSSAGALFVNNSGTLVARGTPDNLITFTSDSATPGHGDYYCAIYIDETASVSTKITYSVIEFAYVGIATNNIRLDNPIQNNYIHYCAFGIGEFGTEHTDIANNQIFGSYYSGINIYMASDSGAVDRDSKILIKNNTCDFYQNIGITIYGSAFEEDAGVVEIINNIVSDSQKYGLNLVDEYYVVDFIRNMGYYNNKHNKNVEFKETEPVIATEFPYIMGESPLKLCFLDQNCPFIDAGLGNITQNPELLCSTTSLQEDVDSDTTDIGFHYPNFNTSNAGKVIGDNIHPNISVEIAAYPHNISDVIDISASGHTGNTAHIFLFMDGEYMEKIWCSGYIGTVALESYRFGNGLHELKIVSIDWDGVITLSKNIPVKFNNTLYCLQTSETIYPNRDYIVCAMYSGKYDLEVKAVDIRGNVRWSTIVSDVSNGINVSIPPEPLKGIQLGKTIIEEIGKGKTHQVKEKIETSLNWILNVPYKFRFWYHQWKSNRII